MSKDDNKKPDAAPAASGPEAEIAKLKAELLAKDAQVAAAERVADAAKARQAAAERHAGKAAELEAIPKERNVQRISRADASAARRELMAKTAKQNGFAYYRLAGELYYRDGVTHPPGAVVRIPEKEEPSYTWGVVAPDELVSKSKAPVQLDEAGRPRAHDKQL